MGTAHALRAASDECGFKASTLARLLVVGWLIGNSYLRSPSQQEITTERGCSIAPTPSDLATRAQTHKGRGQDG